MDINEFDISGKNIDALRLKHENLQSRLNALKLQENERNKFKTRSKAGSDDSEEESDGRESYKHTAPQKNSKKRNEKVETERDSGSEDFEEEANSRRNTKHGKSGKGEQKRQPSKEKHYRGEKKKDFDDFYFAKEQTGEESSDYEEEVERRKSGKNSKPEKYDKRERKSRAQGYEQERKYHFEDFYRSSMEKQDRKELERKKEVHYFRKRQDERDRLRLEELALARAARRDRILDQQMEADLNLNREKEKIHATMRAVMEMQNIEIENIEAKKRLIEKQIEHVHYQNESKKIQQLSYRNQSYDNSNGSSDKVMITWSQEEDDNGKGHLPLKYRDPFDF